MECTCIAKHYYKRKEKEIYILSHFVQKNIRELQIKNRTYMATIEINV